MGKALASCSGMRRYLEQEMFAILDRRIGKRTLLKLKEDISNQPLWLQEFYRLRIKAELYTAT